MFGNLTADSGKLTPEENLRYQAAYCGLCRCLRERFGQTAGLTLNYDLCFLVLLLNSLYEPEERAGEGTCVVHPFKSRPWWQSEFTEYAADMNLALSWLKLRDNWEDDGSLGALAGAQLLRGRYEQVRGRYPQQCAVMEREILALRRIEQQNLETPDEAAETFANIMAEVFVCREDRWSKTLRVFGASLGRFLYVLDAALDLDRDTLRNRYNPFRRRYTRPDNGEFFRDVLKVQLGECLTAFDRLPLVTDAGLLKNILCFGLWTEFDKKYATEKDG